MKREIKYLKSLKTKGNWHHHYNRLEVSYLAKVNKTIKKGGK